MLRLPQACIGFEYSIVSKDESLSKQYYTIRRSLDNIPSRARVQAFSTQNSLSRPIRSRIGRHQRACAAVSFAHHVFSPQDHHRPPSPSHSSPYTCDRLVALSSHRSLSLLAFKAAIALSAPSSVGKQRPLAAAPLLITLCLSSPAGFLDL